MADMRYYDSNKKALEYVEGASGSIKTTTQIAAGTSVIGKVSLQTAGADVSAGNALPVSVGGASINITAPSPDTVTNTPVTGVKTVVATAAEVFAGASVLSGRKQLGIRNDDSVNRIRIGPSTVTQQSGYPIEPGASAEFRFDAATAKAIYAISEGAAITVEVWEA